jgi:hypothetical protein
MPKPLTAQEMYPACGHTVMVRFGDIDVECRILDVKQSWGKPRFLVTPMAGQGDQWVELTRMTAFQNTEGLCLKP